MLVYQAQPKMIQSLAVSRESHDAEHEAEQEAYQKFQRYHMAAIKDADLLINIWSAMTSDNQGTTGANQSDGYQVGKQSMFSPRLSITQDELDILDADNEEQMEDMDDSAFFYKLRTDFAESSTDRSTEK